MSVRCHLNTARPDGLIRVIGRKGGSLEKGEGGLEGDYGVPAFTVRCQEGVLGGGGL